MNFLLCTHASDGIVNVLNEIVVDQKFRNWNHEM